MLNGLCQPRLQRNRSVITKTIEAKLSAEGRKFGIVASRFNSLVVHRLLDGTLDCLRRHGAADEDITIVHCPGSFEIPQITLRLARSGEYDAIVCLGCVVRGETPHFDYIAAEVAKGVGQVALQTGTPVSFGVLTTDSLEQALERAGITMKDIKAVKTLRSQQSNSPGWPKNSPEEGTAQNDEMTGNT